MCADSTSEGDSGMAKKTTKKTNYKYLKNKIKKTQYYTRFAAMFHFRQSRRAIYNIMYAVVCIIYIYYVVEYTCTIIYIYI